MVGRETGVSRAAGVRPVGLPGREGVRQVAESEVKGPQPCSDARTRRSPRECRGPGCLPVGALSVERRHDGVASPGGNSPIALAIVSECFRASSSWSVSANAAGPSLEVRSSRPRRAVSERTTSIARPLVIASRKLRSEPRAGSNFWGWGPEPNEHVLRHLGGQCRSTHTTSQSVDRVRVFAIDVREPSRVHRGVAPRHPRIRLPQPGPSPSQPIMRCAAVVQSWREAGTTQAGRGPNRRRE